ncbi:MAG: winged helix-turn-helix domain-containing protein [Prolixibacteraceae bacterium]|nr:winged helix-turn-helix domain-containing protein [Prolixibacteraceae bacterium]
MDRILKSKTFSKSTTANILLKYLVEMSIQQKDITAADVGHELFGVRYTQEKSDATVRVNVYHLRKKLEKYFEDEGKHDPLIIQIERGQYTVTFKKKELVDKKRKQNIIGVVAFLLVLVGILFFVSGNKMNNKVWDDMFANDFQTTLYLTPIYGYFGPSETGRYVYHRNSKINSDEDLYYTLDSLNISKELFVPDRPYYVTFEDAATLEHFTRLFTQNKNDFVVRRATDFKMSNIKSQNGIYLSPMRYRTLMSDLFNDFSKNIDIDKTRREVVYLHCAKTPSRPDTTILLKSDTRTYEYAIAAKFCGANNTSHLMFFADHGIGLSGMAEYFTNNDSIEAFSKKYLQETNEFVALFYVSGKDRTNLNLELILFDDNQ